MHYSANLISDEWLFVKASSFQRHHIFFFSSTLEKLKLTNILPKNSHITELLNVNLTKKKDNLQGIKKNCNIQWEKEREKKESTQREESQFSTRRLRINITRAHCEKIVAVSPARIIVTTILCLAADSLFQLYSSKEKKKIFFSRKRIFNVNASSHRKSEKERKYI